MKTWEIRKGEGKRLRNRNIKESKKKGGGEDLGDQKDYVIRKQEELPRKFWVLLGNPGSMRNQQKMDKTGNKPPRNSTQTNQVKLLRKTGESEVVSEH